jgi:hypothetical protein
MTIFIAVPKDTRLDIASERLESIKFIFASSEASDQFLGNNHLISSRNIAFLDNMIEESVVLLNNKSAYIEFVLPKLLKNRSIKKIMFYDDEKSNISNLRFNIFASLRGRYFDNFFFTGEDFVDFYLQKMPTRIFYPIVENGKMSLLGSLDFSKYSAGKNSDTILFVPNGCKLNGIDFTLEKLAEQLARCGLKNSLLCIKDGSQKNTLLSFDEIVEFKDLFALLSAIIDASPRFIVYRGWMHSYIFGAIFSNLFNNTCVYLKDWNFANRAEYAFLFKDDRDFDAVREIFRSAKAVFSHYSDAEVAEFERDFDLAINNHCFLPEICDPEKFISKKRIYKDISIVHAGSLPVTSLPEEFFPTKYMFIDSKTLSKKELSFFFVVAENAYDYITKIDAHNYMDWLYEDFSNKRFSVIRGKNMDPTVIEGYHWGVFELTDSTKYNRLIKNAVPSKLAFYLEAGLPLLVNNKLEYLSELTKKHNLGIVFSNSDVPNLDKILNSISQEEYNTKVEAVWCFRNMYYNDCIRTIKNIFIQNGELL